jgi:hypothetical protein
MGNDEQTVEISRIVAYERFENVLLIANYCNSEETHCGLSIAIDG